MIIKKSPAEIEHRLAEVDPFADPGGRVQRNLHGPHQFLHKQRVPSRACVDPGNEGRRDSVRPYQVTHQRRGLHRPQRGDRHLVKVCIVCPGVAKPGTRGAQHQNGPPGQGSHQKIQQLLRAWIEPVAIFDQQAQGGVGRLLEQHLATGVLEPPPLHLWIEGRQLRRGHRDPSGGGERCSNPP